MCHLARFEHQCSCNVNITIARGTQIGIDPPCGVLLYGPPGTGKTMLAKAVAHHTTAAFIRVVGSEFVQKYLGEGPRMVRDVFRLAKENSPAIILHRRGARVLVTLAVSAW